MKLLLNFHDCVRVSFLSRGDVYRLGATHRVPIKHVRLDMAAAFFLGGYLNDHAGASAVHRSDGLLFVNSAINRFNF